MNDTRFAVNLKVNVTPFSLHEISVIHSVATQDGNEVRKLFDTVKPIGAHAYVLFVPPIQNAHL